jgi:hypothetical protein
MAIISVARFKAPAARVPDMFEIAKTAKRVFLANGAERVDYGSVLAGTGPGEWVLLMYYPNLATMERAFASAMADPEFSKAFTNPDPPSELTDRSIITLVDI